MKEVSLLGHTTHVVAVSLSQDNNQVVSCSSKGTIIIHSIETGAILYSLTKAHAAQDLKGLSYTPNDTNIVTCSQGIRGNLIVWSVKLELVQVLDEGHVNCVTQIAASPNCPHFFVSCSWDETAVVWSKEGGSGLWSKVQTLRDHSGWVYVAKFSKNGNLLATGSEDLTVNLYSFNANVDVNGDHALLQHTLSGHKYWINSIAFLADSTGLCSSSVDKTIKVWSSFTGNLAKSIQHTAAVYCVECSPNGRVLVSAGNGKLSIFNAETFELKHTGELDLALHFTITADSRWIVTANDDSTVRVIGLKEYWVTSLSDILNLVLHIIYKSEFVKFPDLNVDMLPHEEAMWRLGDCVADGGYDVVSVMLSFLSPSTLPVQITPTRWKSKSRNLKEEAA